MMHGEFARTNASLDLQSACPVPSSAQAAYWSALWSENLPNDTRKVSPKARQP